MDWTAIRLMIRRLVRRPGFTAAAVVTLALGIGATVAIWSVVYGVLIRPLPYADADRLVGLWHSSPTLGVDKFNQSYGSYTLYRERAKTIENAGLYNRETFTITGGSEPERLFGARVTSSVFPVLGVDPMLGRGFGPEDDRSDGPDVVIIGYDFWQRRLGGRNDAIGAVLEMEGRPWEVIGVMPKGFAFPEDQTAIWTPHPIDAEELSEVNFSFDTIARLRPGVTAAQASAEVDALLRELPEAYPGAMTEQMLEQSGISAFANPLRSDLVGDIHRLLWVLLAAVGFVLVIACANVANLLLVRAEGRHRELAVRVAMGASRRRLAGDLMLESIVLAALGGTLGVGLAWLGIKGLRLLEPGNLPRLADIRIDGSVVAFAAAVSLVAGLAFGLLPSLRLRDRILGAALAEGGRGGVSGRSSQRMRSVLVVAQMALALVLLFGSALMMRSFHALSGVDAGFDRETVLTQRVTLHGDRYEESEARARFWTRLVDGARAIPGARAAATVMNLPLTDGETNPGYIIEDFPPQPDDPPLVARQNMVTDGYFETLGIPILAGRGFERRDIDQRASTTIISAAFARRIWGEESPIGKRLKRGLPTDQRGPWYEIVGVVGDVRDDDLAGDPVEMVYFSVLQQEGDESGWTPSAMTLTVSVDGGDPTRLTTALGDLVRSADPQLPLLGARTTAAIARRAMARTTFTMTLLGAASIIAIILGSIGIYGVLAHSVVQRTREIGVRLALGANQGQVRGMLVGQGMRLAGIGVAIGLIGAVVAGRVLAALLFGITATDPPSFAATVLLLILVAAAASFLPAQRAARIAPTEALRHE